MFTLVLRAALTLVALTFIGLGPMLPARAATSDPAPADPEFIRTAPKAADAAIARQAIAANSVHAHLLRTSGERRIDALNASQMRASQKRAMAHQAGAVGAPPPAVIYPDDLFYNGGPVMPTAEIHNIYVNCTSGCWGAPATFLKELGQSNWIHVLDQYVGATGNDRYRYLGHIAENVSIFTNVLYENDILALVHAAVVSAGNKPYQSVYNVFLPKGVDTCFNGSTVCYSPDNPSTFAFCAYHGSATFSDVGHVIYSVLPFADVAGCTGLTTSPNGLVTDATDSVLSHETFELLTDPDLNAWYTFPFGSEIGDNCAYLYNFEHLLGHTYEVQTEYSNIVHGCVADYIP